MNKFEIFESTEDEVWEKALTKIPSLVDQVKKSTLKVVQDLIPFLKEEKNFSINLCLSNNKTVHELNNTFRHIDKPTNVLSFANLDGDDFEEILKHETDIELGDIIIAYEQTATESETLEIPFEEHFKHLLVHGILHILGFDHIKEEDRKKMEALEIEILSSLHVPNPYQE